MQCLCDCFTRRNRLDHKAEDKQRTVQAHARSTSHVKQKVIKHRKGNEPWSVWDQKAEEEAKLTVQMLGSTQASEPPQLPVFKIKQKQKQTKKPSNQVSPKRN